MPNRGGRSRAGQLPLAWPHSRLTSPSPRPRTDPHRTGWYDKQGTSMTIAHTSRGLAAFALAALPLAIQDRKSTRLNSSHVRISYAVFCLKKKKKKPNIHTAHT